MKILVHRHITLHDPHDYVLWQGSMRIFISAFSGGNGIQVPVGTGVAFAQKYRGYNHCTSVAFIFLPINDHTQQPPVFDAQGGPLLDIRRRAPRSPPFRFVFNVSSMLHFINHSAHRPQGGTSHRIDPFCDQGGKYFF
jgi:hypothetical protein